MKLNNHEIGLLAQEVHAKLSKSINPKVPEGLLARIKTYKDKYEKLKKEQEKAESALEEHEQSWDDIQEMVPGIYASDSHARIVQRIKESQIPSISDIKNKIVLKGLFSKSEDMEDFIASVIKEFAKPKKVTA